MKIQKSKRELKNLAKNLALLFLTLLLVLLTALGWVHDLSLTDIPTESWLGRWYINLSYGEAGGFELRSGEIPAALPAEFAVRTADEMRGAQYNEIAVRSFLATYGAQISAALSSITELRQGTEQAYQKALCLPGVYFRYDSRLPLSLITNWVGGNYIGDEDPIVQSVLLGQDGVLWLRTDTNMLYEIHGKPMEGTLSAHDLAGLPCGFAAEQDYPNVLPETLLFPQTMELHRLTSEAPQFNTESQASLQILLQAFGYAPYMRNYEDTATKSRVFVGNQSTLRVGSNGEVVFRANTVEGGLEAYLQNELGSEQPLPYQIDYARSLLENIFQSFSADATFFCDSYLTEEKTTQILFRYVVNGVPVEGQEGILAVVEYQSNALVSAKLNLRSFRQKEDSQMLMPTAPAAAAATEPLCSLAVGYFSAESGLIPSRYYVKEEQGR